MRKLMLFLGIIFTPILSDAQTLKGKLVDESSTPVEFANVVIRRTS